MQTAFDIAVCGAGPVGLTLAAQLVGHGVPAERIALIDGRSSAQSASDPRAIALSYGSRQILEAVGAWPAEVTPIHQIHVSRRGHFGRTLIDRAAYGLPALGYVTRYGALVRALDARIAASGIHVMRPATVDSIDEDEDAVAVTLHNGENIRAALAVQAEGGIFSEQKKKATHRDYRQTAIVSHVRCSAPLSHRAFERFTDEGPLALLPQEDGYALVWCARPATAERLMALADSQFLAELGQTFGGRLGYFTSATKRHAFPLGLNASPAASARIIAIGNAAQTLHPVAGQGLNLGLRDATVLARLLARETPPSVLQEFFRERRADRRTTVQLTDVMARIFTRAPGQFPLPGALPGLTLGLIDGFPPAKHLLAEQMMFGHRI